MPGWLRSVYVVAMLTAVLGLGLAGCDKSGAKKDTEKKEAEKKEGDKQGGDKKGSEPAGNPKVTKANFEKIKFDMPEKDIKDLLGEPSETKDVAGAKEYTWKNGNDNIKVTVKDGKVDGKSSQIVTTSK